MKRRSLLTAAFAGAVLSGCSSKAAPEATDESPAVPTETTAPYTVLYASTGAVTTYVDDSLDRSSFVVVEDSATDSFSVVEADGTAILFEPTEVEPGFFVSDVRGDVIVVRGTPVTSGDFTAPEETTFGFSPSGDLLWSFPGGEGTLVAGRALVTTERADLSVSDPSVWGLIPSGDRLVAVRDLRTGKDVAAFSSEIGSFVAWVGSDSEIYDPALQLTLGSVLVDPAPGADEYTRDETGPALDFETLSVVPRETITREYLDSTRGRASLEVVGSELVFTDPVDEHQWRVDGNDSSAYASISAEFVNISASGGPDVVFDRTTGERLWDIDLEALIADGTLPAEVDGAMYPLSKTSWLSSPGSSAYVVSV